MNDRADLVVWLVVWGVVTAIAALVQTRRRTPSTGLVLAYLLNLWSIHWLGALIYACPWYTYGELGVVADGFRQTSYALAAAAVGSVGVAPVVMRALAWPRPLLTPRVAVPRLATAYTTVGLGCFFVLNQWAANVPTLSALLAGGWRLLIVGLGLSLWNAWQRRDPKALSWWLAACCFGLPLLTILTQGFLSFGAAAVLAVVVFAASFIRPRWKVLLAFALAGYLGLSFFVTYMRDRALIREQVWGGSAMERRVEQLRRTVEDFEWLNLREEAHLLRIDDRLNQNFLVGAAVRYLGSGFVPFARGETVWNAVIALVPRVLWPSKPVSGGSGTVVSEYTGMTFAEGTSVGIGQVLEFYLNFGPAGVILGTLLIGMAVGILDQTAGQRLAQHDWQGFAYWYLPGLSLIEVGGSLVEMSSSAAAGLATVYLVNRYLLRRLRGRAARRADRPGGV